MENRSVPGDGSPRFQQAIHDYYMSPVVIIQIAPHFGIFVAEDSAADTSQFYFSPVAAKVLEEFVARHDGKKCDAPQMGPVERGSLELVVGDQRA